MKKRYTILLILTIFYLLISISLYISGELGQALAVLITATIFYILFSLLKKIPKKTKKMVRSEKVPISSTTPIPPTKQEKHNVTGTSHYTGAIESLGTKNYCYNLPENEFFEVTVEDERQYEYLFNPNRVELIEEPTNPYDPNAIKVVIDDVLVGYIKKGSCSHIKKLLHSNLIVKINAKITGGRYKSFYSEYSFDKGENIRKLEEDESSYYVDIILTVKDSPTVKVSASSSEKTTEALVWIDNTASCYHVKNGCGMNNAYQVPLSKARAMGKKACKRCYS